MHSLRLKHNEKNVQSTKYAIKTHHHWTRLVRLYLWKNKKSIHTNIVDIITSIQSENFIFFATTWTRRRRGHMVTCYERKFRFTKYKYKILASYLSHRFQAKLKVEMRKFHSCLSKNTHAKTKEIHLQKDDPFSSSTTISASPVSTKNSK